MDEPAHSLIEDQSREPISDLEQTKREFAAFSGSVSHDLRAPLRAIERFAQILQQENASSLGPEGVRLFDVISRNVGKMGELIDGLQAYSRLYRQDLRMDMVDMAGLARSVVQDVQLLESNPAAKIVMGELLPARGDRATLRQVWTHLLSNALKFSSRAAEPKIELGCTRGAHEVIYFVRDNGAGFDMKYSFKLFVLFQRLHGRELFEGSGVGLAFVHRIVARHGGRVWGEGMVDQGATFYFTLPVDTATP